MAQRTLKPGQAILLIDTAGGTSYDTVVCLTEFSYTASTNVIDLETFCGLQKLPGVVDPGEVSFSGSMETDVDANKVSYQELYAAWSTKAVIGWRIETVTPVSGDPILTGTGFLSDTEFSFSPNDANTFSNTITVTGIPALTEAP